MEKDLKELETIIKYSFNDHSLLNRSLTHKSFDNKKNNEKLEFLGDRVLGLVISYKLLEKFPHEKEGIIDKKLANLVNKKTCLSIGKKINLKKFLILGTSHKNLDRSEDKIISGFSFLTMLKLFNNEPNAQNISESGTRKYSENLRFIDVLFLDVLFLFFEELIIFLIFT